MYTGTVHGALFSLSSPSPTRIKEHRHCRFWWRLVLGVLGWWARGFAAKFAAWDGTGLCIAHFGHFGGTVEHCRSARTSGETVRTFLSRTEQFSSSNRTLCYAKSSFASNFISRSPSPFPSKKLIEVGGGGLAQNLLAMGHLDGLEPPVGDSRELYGITLHNLVYEEFENT